MPASVNKVGLISLVLSNSAGLGHSFRALCTTSLDTWLAREIRQELYSRYVGQHVVIPGKRRWVNRPSPEYGRRITALGSSLAAASPKSGGNGDPPEIKREPIEISSGTQVKDRVLIYKNINYINGLEDCADYPADEGGWLCAADPS